MVASVFIPVRWYLRLKASALQLALAMQACRPIHAPVKCLALAVVAILSALPVCHASQVYSFQFSSTDPVINFNTGTTALPTIPGVQFAGGDDSFSNGGFGPQYFGNLVGAGGYSYLDIYFSQPVQAVGADLVSATPSVTGVTEVVFNQSGTQLESESAPMSAGFLGVGEGANQISRVEWRYSSPGFFGVRNVVYGTLVPEPSTGALVFLGLTVAGCRRMARRIS